ncbi:HlyD family efflux transporter periplasmic adaptor subunit [Streptomyces sp. VRA16 Mangrove soil]|uniref:HlyD family efflux transporter periplasmic adaptor subunit n=1 Tax=Streptomyces sp. VRA16 Mangrove soil TaxID=2817434 RepID=UPI001A9D5CF2|nr:HlyD family efflux transporter periplasmic adaptor subunit [Streptomyces sp. VRA16 Mangrove soil]MBO1330873.1 HlyD family efflux transporter periplasmic adaptor subunit [Streptomyces sp. VRA16 Mangrove soil]
MQFRQQALSKLQSPESLDLPVRLARPQGLLALAVTVVVMAASCVWAVTGSVSSTVTASGILTYGQGSYVLQTPVTGQVTGVYVKEGQRVAADAPLLKIRTTRGDRAVRAIDAGRVTALVARIGSVVRTGADVATVEKTGSARDPLVAMVYVPATGAANIPAGASVDLTVPAAQQHGVLRGTVKAVGRAAQTRRQIADFLGDTEIAGQLARGGARVPVLVQLKRSASTDSGYAWSTDDGPPWSLTSMTLTSGAVHLAAQRPIDWLLP